MKEKEVVKRIKKQVRGITLMVLVVTIIVLLILAGVGLRLALGENGIIGGTINAKEEAEIAEEKETVHLAAFGSKVKNNKLILLEDEFQKSLDGYTGVGKTEVTDVGEEFEVVFNETNRYYVVDKNGNLKEAGEIVKDNYPGDITVGKNGESLDGSEEHPYEIWCIEDLVAFSNLSNNTGYVYENGELKRVGNQNGFQGKYIVLKKNLNFKSTLSYADSKRTEFGDINGIEDDGNELMNEMLTGTGFNPMSKVGADFKGNFNGENNKIFNIYINEDDGFATGFFRYIATESKISNLNVYGDIKGTESAGGIAGRVVGGGIIENCINYANITGCVGVGGICGAKNVNGTLEIVKCKNYGKIEIIESKNGAIGGIIGSSSDGEIKQCENYGNISNEGTNAPAGGIIGSLNNGTIDNCINRGNLYREQLSGGIVGNLGISDITIINSCNYGESYCGIANKLYGSGDNFINLNIKNCYNLGDVTNTGIIGEISILCKNSMMNIENCYTAGKSNIAIIGKKYISPNSVSTTNINIKNTYYDKTKSESIGAIEEGITEVSIKNNSKFVNTLNANIEEDDTLKRWKLGEDGYPIFE